MYSPNISESTTDENDETQKLIIKTILHIFKVFDNEPHLILDIFSVIWQVLVQEKFMQALIAQTIANSFYTRSRKRNKVMFQKY